MLAVRIRYNLSILSMEYVNLLVADRLKRKAKPCGEVV